MDIFKIINGWENFMEKSETTEEMAKDRATVCGDCPMLKEGWLTAFIKDNLVEIQGCYCSKCTCPISAKIRSINETCPLNKW